MQPVQKQVTCAVLTPLTVSQPIQLLGLVELSTAAMQLPSEHPVAGAVGAAGHGAVVAVLCAACGNTTQLNKSASGGLLFARDVERAVALSR